MISGVMGRKKQNKTGADWLENKKEEVDNTYPKFSVRKSKEMDNTRGI